MKWHNGKAFTSEDAKWSYDRCPRRRVRVEKRLQLDREDGSAGREHFVMTAKFPNADLLADIAFKGTPPIMERQHHESGAPSRSSWAPARSPIVSTRRLRCSTWRAQPQVPHEPVPVLQRDRPPWHVGRREEDRRLHLEADARDLLVRGGVARARRAAAQGRHQAQYPQAGAATLYMRNDKPPFNDKRVRQALSMGYDRKILSTRHAGEGEADQALSCRARSGSSARQDLSSTQGPVSSTSLRRRSCWQAAGITLPLKFDLPHWDPTVIGQKFVDEINLIEPQWKQDGIADVTDIKADVRSVRARRSTGNYDPRTGARTRPAPCRTSASRSATSTSRLRTASRRRR